MVRGQILLASSSQLLLAGIRGTLAGSHGLSIVGEVHHPGKLLVAARRARPDIALLDALMFADLARAVRALRDVSPSPVVVLRDRRSVDVCAEARAAGAVGAIPRAIQPDSFREALTRALDGGGWDDEPPRTTAPLPLTERERAVVALVARGLSNKQIAYEVDVAEHTVKFVLRRVFSKLGVANRTELLTLPGVRAVA